MSMTTEQRVKNEVTAIGEMIIEKAESIASDLQGVSSIKINAKICADSIPTIEVVKEMGVMIDGRYDV